MLELLLGEKRRREEEADQWKERAEKAEHLLKQSDKLLVDYQKASPLQLSV